MSDDRDEPNAAGNGNGKGPGGDPALVTTPLRPTGKRSRQREGGVALAEREDIDEALTEEFDALDGKDKKTKKAPTDTGGTRNPLLFVWNYLRQVSAEISKVIWPSRREMVNYTIVVLVFLAIMTTLIGLVDLGLAKLVLLVFG